MAYNSHRSQQCRFFMAISVIDWLRACVSALFQWIGFPLNSRLIVRLAAIMKNCVYKIAISWCIDRERIQLKMMNYFEYLWHHLFSPPPSSFVFGYTEYVLSARFVRRCTQQQQWQNHWPILDRVSKKAKTPAENAASQSHDKGGVEGLQLTWKWARCRKWNKATIFRWAIFLFIASAKMKNTAADVCRFAF